MLTEAFNNLGMMNSLPSFTHVDVQASGQATMWEPGTRRRPFMHFRYPELLLGRLWTG